MIWINLAVYASRVHSDIQIWVQHYNYYFTEIIIRLMPHDPQHLIWQHFILVMSEHEYTAPAYTWRDVRWICTSEVICVHSMAVHVSFFICLFQRPCELRVVNVAVIVFVVIPEDIIDEVDEILFLHWLATLSSFLQKHTTIQMMVKGFKSVKS